MAKSKGSDGADKPARKDKAQLAGHFPVDDLRYFKFFLGQLNWNNGTNVTTQGALYEALCDWVKKKGGTLPSQQNR
jgi:hypothetical protein